MIVSVFTSVLGLVLLCTSAVAESKDYLKANVSFEDFKILVGEVESQRSERLIDLDTFLAMSKEPGTVILDSRSDSSFERVHLAGAKHLSFSDFTQENLEKVIPTFETKVLIYCNNNFEGSRTYFATKMFRPKPPPSDGINGRISAEAKPTMMALNIPTYVNLFGFGYRNVYELNELVDVNDPRITFEGTLVKQKK